MKTKMIRLIAMFVFVTMLFTATGTGFAADETSTVHVHDGENKTVDGNIVTTGDFEYGAEVRSYFNSDPVGAALTVHGGIDAQDYGVRFLTTGGTITLIADQDITALRSGMILSFYQAEKYQEMTEEIYQQIKDKAVKTEDYGDFVYYEYQDAENETVYRIQLYEGEFSGGSITQTLHFPAKLEAVVKGGITAREHESSWGTSGIQIKNDSHDPDDISVTVGGDVEATGSQYSAYGINASIQADTLSLEIQNGGILVDTENGHATGIYLYTNPVEKDGNDSTATIQVAKDVTVTGTDGATGFVGQMNNGTMIVDFGGNITAKAEYHAAGIQVNTDDSEEPDDSAVTITAGGNITAEGGSGATAFSGNIRYGSELTAVINGNLSAEVTDGSANGIRLDTMDENNKVKAEIKGDISAVSANDEYSWYDSYGINVLNGGGDIQVKAGGNITSSGTGLCVWNQKYTDSSSLTRDEFEAMRDQFELISDEDGTKYYEYSDQETGINYYYYDNDDGSEYGYANIPQDFEATTSVTVDGAVHAAGKHRTTGIDAESNNGNALTVSVGKDVTAESEENSATGITASITGEEDRANTAAITVGGNVTAKGQYDATGFTGDSNQGSSLTADLGGKVTAESEEGTAKAIQLSTLGEGTRASVSVSDNVKATGNGENSYGGSAVAVAINNHGGTAEVKIGSDLVSNGTGIQTFSGAYQGTEYMDQAEVEALMDKLVLDDDDGSLKHYTYTDEKTGDSYSCYVIHETGDAHGYHYFTKDYAGATSVTVGGSVASEGQFAVTGINGSISNASSATLSVGKDLTAVSRERSAYGVDVSVGHEDADLQVAVGGNLTAKAEPTYTQKGTRIDEDGAEYEHEYTRYNEAYGGRIRNRGGQITLSVGGDVESSKNGLDVWQVTQSEQLKVTEEELAAIVSQATLERTSTSTDSETGDEITCNTYSYTDENGDEYLIIMRNGKLQYGEVTHHYHADTGVGITGNLTVDGDGTANGVYVYGTNKNGKAEIAIEGSVSTTAKYAATALYSDLADGESSIIVGGDVAAVSRENDARGIDADTSSEESSLIISVGGNLTAQALTASHTDTVWVEDEDGEEHEEEAEENNYASGADLTNRGGKITLDVAGNVETNRNGLSIKQDYTVRTVYLDEDEAKAILSKATLDYTETETDDEGNEHTIEGYSYDDENGNRYCIELYDGEFAYGYEDQRVEDKAGTTVTVGGNVTAGNKDSYANGIFLSGDNKNGTADITVGGSVQASAKDGATGVSGNVYAGSVRAQVAGEVKAESEQSDAYGLFAFAGGENTSAVFSTGGAVSASVKEANEEKNNRAVGVETQVGSLGGNVDVEVLGGISAGFDELPENAVGINVFNRPAENHEGVVTILVTGDVESTGNGVHVVSASLEEEKGNYVASKEKTDIEIIGDVTAGERGLNLERVFNSDVIVDGTVSGGKGAVVLRDDTDASSLMLTVWELVPDENGAVITRYDHTADEDEIEYIEDRELEADVQYIIRVIQPEEGATLSTEGTTEYKGYLVAHEGDTVYLIADMKPGYRIAGAFYDEELTKPMTKEKYNRYFIAVPKGGAVSLSALIERALKLASVKPAYTVTYSEPNDYDTFIETDRNAAKTDRTQIRMDGNGGTVYGQENYFALVRSGSTLTLPRPDEREGFEFAGWYANALTDGAAAPNDDDLISADTQVRAEEASVYTAVWKEAK